MLTLSIIHNPAFIVAAAFLAATLVIAAVFIMTAPVCTPSDFEDFKDFNCDMVKLSTIAFVAVVLGVILNVNLLATVSLFFVVLIFTYELLTFIDPLRTWRDQYLCDKRKRRW